METRLTADVVTLAKRKDKLCVLLIRRGWKPFAGMLALPGGHIDPGERPAEAARRELAEETGIHLDLGQLTLIDTYADPGRDPRGQYATWAYLAVLDGEPPQPTAGDDAEVAEWIPVDSLALADLAFDHWRIIQDALRKKCRPCPPQGLADELRRMADTLERDLTRNFVPVLDGQAQVRADDHPSAEGVRRAARALRTRADELHSGQAPGVAVAVNAEAVTGSIIGADADAPRAQNVRVSMNLGTVSGTVVGYQKVDGR